MRFFRFQILIIFFVGFFLKALFAQEDSEPLIQSHFQGPYKGVAETATGIDPLRIVKEKTTSNFVLARGMDSEGSFIRLSLLGSSPQTSELQKQPDIKATLSIRRVNIRTGESQAFEELPGYPLHSRGFVFEWRRSTNFLDSSDWVVTSIQVELRGSNDDPNDPFDTLFLENFQPVFATNSLDGVIFPETTGLIPPFLTREERVITLGKGDSISMTAVTPHTLLQLMDGSVNLTHMVSEVRELSEGSQFKGLTARSRETRRIGLNGSAHAYGFPDPRIVLFRRPDSPQTQCFVGLSALMPSVISVRTIIRE